MDGLVGNDVKVKGAFWSALSHSGALSSQIVVVPSLDVSGGKQLIRWKRVLSFLHEPRFRFRYPDWLI